MNERIRIVRKHFGLTQAEFAARINSKQNTVAQWEIGRNPLQDHSIRLICTEFHVCEHWLRTGEGPMFEDFDREAQLAEWVGRVLGSETDVFKKKFLRMLMSLSEKEWAYLEKKAKELADDNE